MLQRVYTDNKDLLYATKTSFILGEKQCTVNVTRTAKKARLRLVEHALPKLVSWIRLLVRSC